MYSQGKHRLEVSQDLPIGQGVPVTGLRDGPPVGENLSAGEKRR
jgi:hypothetical protein